MDNKQSGERSFSNEAMPEAIVLGSIRNYYCKACNISVSLCSKCDRGNIYCKICGPIQKKLRRAINTKRYIQSPKGIETKAKIDKRYYENKKKRSLVEAENKTSEDLKRKI
jgi:hypothetical protein